MQIKIYRPRRTKAILAVLVFTQIIFAIYLYVSWSTIKEKINEVDANVIKQKTSILESKGSLNEESFNEFKLRSENTLNYTGLIYDRVQRDINKLPVVLFILLVLIFFLWRSLPLNNE